MKHYLSRILSNKSYIFFVLLLMVCSREVSDSAELSLKDYRNFYAVVWRGTSSDNLRYAKQMGYHYVAHQSNMQQLPEAKDTKFYLMNPELDVSSVSIALDITKTFSSNQKMLYEKYFVWKSDAETFPNNIATGWWYNENTFLIVYDFQQQAVIDEVVEAIINKAKSYENPSINYTFGGLMWDVPDLKGDFWTGGSSNRKFVDLSYWTGKDSCASSKHLHDYATYSDGKAAFFKNLYKRVREEFPDAKFVFEPYIIYDRWINEIKERPDAKDLMPNMLTQEASGTEFLNDSRIYDSGLIRKEQVGLTVRSIFDEYQNRLHAAKVAINGAWIGWFGSFGGFGNMPNYQNIYEVPARIQLVHVLPNWDNLANIPLSERQWDGEVYKSPNSYADANIIYSRHPETGKIFAVFLNTAGKIKLSENERVNSVYRTDGLFIETEDGSNDIQFINGEIILVNYAGIGKGYIISTTLQLNNNTPPSPPTNLRVADF